MPQSLRLDRLGATAWSASGRVAVARWSRLAAALAADHGDLEVEVLLTTSVPRRLRGRVRAQLPLRCQRCLREFDWPLQLEIDLRLVASDAEERRWLGEDDPCRVEDEVLPLHQILEDEVLLALPLAPCCGRPDCRLGWPPPSAPVGDVK